MTVTSATGETSFALSDTAVKAGATRLVWQREPYPHAALHAFLRRWIYHDQTLLDLVQPALWGASPSSSAASSVRGHSRRLTRARGAHGTPRARRTDARAPAIIDYVPSTATLAGTVRGRRPTDRPTPRTCRSPHGCPRVRRRAIAAGEVTRPRGLPHAPPGSWPDPFFK